MIQRHFVFLLALVALSAQARRAVPEDSGYVVESYKEQIVGQSDGRSTSEVEIVFRILNAIGAERAGLQRVGFNSATQKLTLLEAVTLNGDKKISVDPANIETRSISVSGVGFDDQRRMLIPFPQLAPGSRIRLRTRTETHTASLKDTLQGRTYLPQNVWIQKAEVRVTVPAGVRVEKMDPRNLLEARREEGKKGAKTYVFSGEEIPPDLALGEEDQAPSDASHLWIDYSALKSWEEAAQILSVEYEQILNEPLPPKFAAIVKKFKSEEPAIAAPALWEAFIRELRYFGDWRTVKGAYIPRHLKTIAESGYGDCKDFAVFLAKGLRELGLKARVGIIERGVIPTPLGKLPVMNAFNHAIAILELDGATYLVDGTNPVPHFKLVPSDVADRPFILLAEPPATAALKHTAANAAGESEWISQFEIDPDAAPARRLKLGLKMTGLASWDLQNFLFGKTEGQTRDAILGFLHIPEGTLSGFKFVSIKHRRSPSYLSEIRAELTQEYGLRRAGQLISYPLDPIADVQSLLTVATKDRIMALRMDDPTQKRNIHVIPRHEGLSPAGMPESCAFRSPWFEFSRKIEMSDDWRIEDTFTTLVTKMEPATLESAEFQKVQLGLRECLLKIDAVFRRSAQ